MGILGEETDTVLCGLQALREHCAALPDDTTPVQLDDDALALTDLVVFAARLLYRNTPGTFAEGLSKSPHEHNLPVRVTSAVARCSRSAQRAE